MESNSEIDLSPFLETSERRLRAVKTGFERYLTRRIRWNSRLVGIRGARGTGKTTLLLQQMKREGENNGPGRSLYLSLDNIRFQSAALCPPDPITSHGTSGGLFHVEHGEAMPRDCVADKPRFADSTRQIPDATSSVRPGLLRPCRCVRSTRERGRPTCGATGRRACPACPPPCATSHGARARNRIQNR